MHAIDCTLQEFLLVEIAASFNDSPSDLYVYNLNAEGDVVKGVLRNYDDNDVQSQSNNSSSDEIVRSTKRLRRISTSSGSLTDPDQPVALNISKRDQNYNLKKRLKALSFKFRKHQDFYDLFKRFPDKILKYLNRLQKKENDNKLIIKKLMVYGESLDLNGKNVISHEGIMRFKYCFGYLIKILTYF
ncbi:uncharacterized protein LOC106643065 [Copidosoma floridanum]|uniref:uncharacterized protein LOC106643065 n=1 Tax=Copidosoma floridanum TaxID=29053 RepID=UPI0006C99955|nr:uncharacterized protein LOC106643065 [Copidosoma floridanum]